MAEKADKTLTPADVAAKLFGPLSGFVASEGKTYTTDEGYTGQRIARAYMPFLLDGKPSGLTMPVNVSRLVNDSGTAAATSRSSPRTRTA